MKIRVGTGGLTSHFPHIRIFTIRALMFAVGALPSVSANETGQWNQLS